MSRKEQVETMCGSVLFVALRNDRAASFPRRTATASNERAFPGIIGRSPGGKRRRGAYFHVAANGH